METKYGDGELVDRRAADGERVVRLPWATLYTRERVDEQGFRGAAVDVTARTLEARAPWLQAARRVPRKRLQAESTFAWRTTSLMRAAEAGDELRVYELLTAGAPLRLRAAFTAPATRRRLPLAYLGGASACTKAP